MCCLSSPERDDSADRIVGRHPDRYAIAWNNFDAEAAHAAAQLREHFVARVTLHSVEAARMNGDDGALHIDQIVFAQYLILLRIRLAISVPQRGPSSNSIIFRQLITASQRSHRLLDLCSKGRIVVPAQAEWRAECHSYASGTYE
jgi:hypothetical protein